MRGARGRHDDVVGIDAVARLQLATQGLTPVALLPPVEAGVERFAADRLDGCIEQAGLAQMQHDLRHSAGQKHLHGGKGAVGQRIDQSRHQAIDRGPVSDGGALEPRRVGDGGNVEQQIGGSAKGCVDHHGVANGCVGENILGADVQLVHAQDGAAGAARRIKPDGLARRRERRVGQSQPESFAYYL